MNIVLLSSSSGAVGVGTYRLHRHRDYLQHQHRCRQNVHDKGLHWYKGNTSNIKPNNQCSLQVVV